MFDLSMTRVVIANYLEMAIETLSVFNCSYR
jgi:hypothetical protein